MRLFADNINTKPTDIKVHLRSRVLEICFDDGQQFMLPFEYLRVFTPSAEAIGHGTGQEVLQVGKEDINITEIRPIGNYAIAPKFSDGHDSGIFSWALLYKLGSEFESLWAGYLQRLEAAGYQRNIVSSKS